MPTAHLRVVASNEPLLQTISHRLLEQAKLEALKTTKGRYNAALGDFELKAAKDYLWALGMALEKHTLCKSGSLLLAHEGPEPKGERPKRAVKPGSAEHLQAIAQQLQFVLSPPLSMQIAQQIVQGRLPY